MALVVQIKVHPSLYVRDPEETVLGRKIIGDSIRLIDQIGFEEFTFKKLATKIKSTEASVYRYFRNKNQLLAYLVSWYWEWLQYLIQVRTMNVDDPRKQMEVALAVLIDSSKYDPAIPHVDEALLHRICVAESARVYLTKHKKGEKFAGLFQGYEDLCAQLLTFMKSLNPKYKYSRELVSAIIAAVHNQVFYTEIAAGAMKGELKDVKGERTLEFLNHLVFTSLG